jgi:hypothetical protein
MILKNSIKSVSFLLRQKHGFKQAPYEEIDQKTYEKIMSKIKIDDQDKINTIGDTSLDGLECEGGACPIK